MSNFENVDAVLEIFFGLLLDFFKKKYMDVFLSCALISPITSLVRDVQLQRQSRTVHVKMGG